MTAEGKTDTSWRVHIPTYKEYLGKETPKQGKVYTVACLFLMQFKKIYKDIESGFGLKISFFINNYSYRIWLIPIEKRE